MAADVNAPAPRTATLEVVIGFGLCFVVVGLLALFVDRLVPLDVYVIERAEPLVEALRRYEKAHGELPPSASDLVPEFISQKTLAGLGRLVYVRNGRGFVFTIPAGGRKDALHCESVAGEPPTWWYVDDSGAPPRKVDVARR